MFSVYQIRSPFRICFDGFRRIEDVEGDGEVVARPDLVASRAVVSAAVADSNRIEN
jgi:hypothetical protein